MPTISLVQLAKIAITLFIIGLILPQIINLASTIINSVNTAINNASSSVSSVNGIDLGYVGRVVGLVDFLNNLMSSVVIASSLFLSSLASVMGVKFLIKFYNMATKI